jgi:hypothetical protein
MSERRDSRIPRQPVRALRDIRLCDFCRDIAQTVPYLRPGFGFVVVLDGQERFPDDTHQGEDDEIEDLSSALRFSINEHREVDSREKNVRSSGGHTPITRCTAASPRSCRVVLA